MIWLKYYVNIGKSLALLYSKFITLEIINFAVLQQNIGSVFGPLSTPPFELPIDKRNVYKEKKKEYLVLKVRVNCVNEILKIKKNIWMRLKEKWLSKNKNNKISE